MAYWTATISGTAVSHGPVDGGYVIRLNNQDMAWAASQPAGAQFSFWSTSAVRFASDPGQYTPTISGGAQILDYTISKTYYPDPPASYSVTCQTDGHGTLSASPSSGTAGTTIALSVSAYSGYVFDHFSISPSRTITNNQFTMPSGNVTVTAYFRANYTNVTAGNYIKATDRSQTGTPTTAGSTLSDSHFSNGESAAASTFNSRVLS